MASLSSVTVVSDGQTTEGVFETVGANVGTSTSFDDFARQQFYKNRKVIINNVPRVTYDVRVKLSFGVRLTVMVGHSQLKNMPLKLWIICVLSSYAT